MRSEHAVPARRLERLSRLPQYEVERHQPDPRGWTVVSREGRHVGSVKDLLVDTERMTATYVEAELDTKLFDFRGDDPRVLIPLQYARRDGDRLVVDDLTSEWVSQLRAARNRHWEEFWERWWHGEAHDPRSDPEVRVPVVEDETVVEHRVPTRR
jgi:sporulation protein YlmC with PRC-barrel domain